MVLFLTIQCSKISFKYVEKQVLEDISISFGSGHLYGIIGPNGSGKTTLIKILSGILKSYYGNVIVDNLEISTLTPKEIAKRIAVVHQTSPINFDFSVEEIVFMGRYSYIGRFSKESAEDQQIVEEILNQFNLNEIKDRNFSELSGGEQQKVIIARTLAQKSRIVLLDEPTNHLDFNYKIEFMETLKKYVKKGLIIIVVLHDLNLAAQFCDKIILLNKGKIHGFGTVDEVITKENMKAVYNIDVVVRRNLFTNSMDIAPIRNNIHFSSLDGKTNKIKKIHIIGGGGSALEIMPKLKDFEVSVGIVDKLDDDYILGKELNYKIISEDPFCFISEKSVENLKKLLIEMDLVILTNFPFGKGNLRNLEILENYNNNLIILEKNPIEERDFTGGIASSIYKKLKVKHNVKIVNNTKELLNLLMDGTKFT